MDKESAALGEFLCGGGVVGKPFGNLTMDLLQPGRLSVHDNSISDKDCGSARPKGTVTVTL